MSYNSYSVPNPYTNDLNSIMLLKLAYNDIPRVIVSRQLLTIDELNDKYFVRRNPQWRKLTNSLWLLRPLN